MVKFTFSEKSKDLTLNVALVISLLLATGMFINSKTTKPPNSPSREEGSGSNLQQVSARQTRVYEALQPIETDVDSPVTSGLHTVLTQGAGGTQRVQNSVPQTSPAKPVHIDTHTGNIQVGISVPGVSASIDIPGLPTQGLF